MVLASKLKATPEKNDINPPANLYASYLQSFYKLLKGESHTMQAIYGFLSAYINDVTAPILLPHKPIELTVPKPRKY